MRTRPFSKLYAVVARYSDVVALTAGVNRYELKDGGHDMVAGVGLLITQVG